MEIINACSSIVLGVLGIVATYIFTISSNKRENDRILKELFIDCNKRYDALNDNLYKYVNGEMAYKNVVIDYFNLCAEEYFWHKKGRIDEKVWKSWQAGMKEWYKHDAIKRLWKEETANGKMSYYLEEEEEFFI